MHWRLLKNQSFFCCGVGSRSPGTQRVDSDSTVMFDSGRRDWEIIMDSLISITQNSWLQTSQKRSVQTWQIEGEEWACTCQRQNGGSPLGVVQGFHHMHFPQNTECGHEHEPFYQWSHLKNFNCVLFMSLSELTLFHGETFEFGWKLPLKFPLSTSFQHFPCTLHHAISWIVPPQLIHHGLVASILSAFSPSPSRPKAPHKISSMCQTASSQCTGACEIWFALHASFSDHFWTELAIVALSLVHFWSPANCSKEFVVVDHVSLPKLWITMEMVSSLSSWCCHCSLFLLSLLSLFLVNHFMHQKVIGDCLTRTERFQGHTEERGTKLLKESMSDMSGSCDNFVQTLWDEGDNKCGFVQAFKGSWTGCNPCGWHKSKITDGTQKVAPVFNDEWTATHFDGSSLFKMNWHQLTVTLENGFDGEKWEESEWMHDDLLEDCIVRQGNGKSIWEWDHPQWWTPSVWDRKRSQWWPPSKDIKHSCVTWSQVFTSHLEPQDLCSQQFHWEWKIRRWEIQLREMNRRSTWWGRQRIGSSVKAWLLCVSMALIGRTIFDGLWFDNNQFKLGARDCQFCEGILTVSEIREFDEDGLQPHQDRQQRDFWGLCEFIHLEFTFEGIWEFTKRADKPLRVVKLAPWLGDWTPAQIGEGSPWAGRFEAWVVSVPTMELFSLNAGQCQCSSVAWKADDTFWKDSAQFCALACDSLSGISLAVERKKKKLVFSFWFDSCPCVPPSAHKSQLWCLLDLILLCRFTFGFWTDNCCTDSCSHFWWSPINELIQRICCCWSCVRPCTRPKLENHNGDGALLFFCCHSVAFGVR